MGSGWNDFSGWFILRCRYPFESLPRTPVRDRFVKFLSVLDNHTRQRISMKWSVEIGLWRYAILVTVLTPNG